MARSREELEATRGELFEFTPEGIVYLGSKMKHWTDEERSLSLLRLPFPSRNHQLRRLGLPSFLPELPREVVMLRLLGAVFTYASLVYGVDSEDHVRKALAVSAATRLTMNVEFGSINVQPGGGRSVEVEA